jgi:Domain of unknown function (DUF4388)
MVEGDLLDLTLPSLLQALTREKSTAMLRLQRGTEDGADQGTVYFREGTLVHAVAGETVGDDAMYQLLGWSDGRFRLTRDADQQPRTVSAKLASVIVHADAGPSSAGTSSSTEEGSNDERLLHDLLTGLSRLEQDKVRLEEGQLEPGSVPALLLIATVVNSMVAIVTKRCTDSDVLPSRVLPRLEEQQPYMQLLGEDAERISVATAVGVLKTWNSSIEDRQQLFQDLCRALLDVLAFYGNTAGTFFRESREREEWRATFGVFVEGLWAAVRQIQAAEPEAGKVS